MRSRVNPRYQGIMAPMVTPFKEGGELDEDALRRLTHYLIERGIHMLFVTGTTGEAWTLSREERGRIWRSVVEEAKGRVPVFAGTGALSTRETIDLTRMAEDAGVDGAIVITPYYITTPNDNELYAHYATVAAGTKLPVFAYNHPLVSGVTMSPELVVRLSELDRICGMKDGRDLTLTIEYIRRTPPDFVVWQGPDALTFAGLVVGCAGAIPAIANLAPALAVEIYRAFEEGDWERAMEAQGRLSHLRSALSLGTFPVALKEAMAIVGMPVGPVRAPASALTVENRRKLLEVLETAGVL